MGQKQNINKEFEQETTLTEKQIQDLVEAISGLAAQDFDNPIEIQNDDSMYDVLALGLNMISEELKETVVSRKELERSEQILKQAQKIGKIGHWTLALEKNELKWSEEVYSIFGVDSESFGATYESFLDFIHPDDRDLVHNAYTDHVNNQAPYKIQHRIITASGELRWVEESCESEFSSEGKALSSVGTVLDITDLKRASTKASNLLNAIHRSGVVCEIDLDGNIIYANQQYIDLFEFEEDEIVGVKYKSGIPDRSETLEQFELLWKKLLNGEYTNETFERTTQKGRTIYISGSYFPILDEFGRLEKILAIGVDVTKEREFEDERERLLRRLSNNEQQLKSLFDNSAIGIAIVEPNSQIIIDGNDTLAELLGYSLNEFRKLRMQDIRPKNIRASNKVMADMSDIKKVLQIQSNITWEGIFLHKKGYEIPVEINLTKGMYGDAIPVLVGYVKDITQRKRNEQVKEVISELAELVGDQNISEYEFCEALHEKVNGLFMTEGFYVCKKTDKETITFVYMNDPKFDGELPFSRTKGKGITEHVLKTKRPLLLGKQQITNFQKNKGLKVHRRLSKAWMGVPIMKTDEVIGVIACQIYTQGYQYSEEDLEILTLIGRQVGNFLEQKATYEALKISEERHRSLFENMNEGMIVSDEAGIVEMVSPKFEEITGYSSSELIGNDGRSLFLDEENRKKVEAKTKERRKGIRSGYELEIVRKDKQRRWVNISASPTYDAQGKFSGTMSIFADITEKKIAEAQRLVTDRALGSAGEGIVITDPNQKDNPIIFVNEAFKSLTGYSEEDVVGKNCRLLQGEDSDPDTIKGLKTAIKGKSYHECEILNYKKDGTPFWNELTINPVFDQDNNLVNFIGIQRDITEKKTAQLREEVVFTIARKANSRLPEIVYLCEVIHRELRKALNAENMYVALLNSEDDTISFPYVKDELIDQKRVKEGYQTRKMANGFTEKVIQGRKPILINDKKSKASGKKDSIGIGKKAKCWLGVPLIADGAVIGALVVQSYDDENAFTNEDMDFVVYVANQISSLIERLQVHLKLIESKDNLVEERTKTLVHQSKLLSTQLNPHFIFNSLNSIQYYILDNDAEPALHFLSKFSALMRAVLENSDHLHISLAKEIEFLRLYIDLEMGRHQGKFDYKINIQDTLNIDEVLIPPMLLQPYIENTIIHGVGHLPKDGMVEIKFVKKKDFVHCIITDNGVGREKASELKQLKTGKSEYRSKSTQIIDDRISILQEIDDLDYSSKLEDLVDKEGNARGTKVSVIFPYLT